MGVEEQAAYERSRCRADRHEPKVIRLQDFQEVEYQIDKVLVGKDPSQLASEKLKRDVTISAWEETRCRFCDLLLDSTDPVSAKHNLIHKSQINFNRDQMPDQVWGETKTRMWHGPEYTEIAPDGWYELLPETAEYLNSVMMQQESIRQYAVDCGVDPDKIKIIAPFQELNGAMMLNPNLAKLAIKWKAKSLRDAQK